MSTERIERFYWSVPDDVLAISHGGRLPMQLIPDTMQSLADTPVESTVNVLIRLRDESGKAIGIGTELEFIPPTGYLQVYFTKVIPGRGMLVSYEEKDYNAPRLTELMEEVNRSGKEWLGNEPIIGTCGPTKNRRGAVLSGTGEFYGMTGEMSQTMNFRRIRPGNAPATVDNCETYWLKPKA